MQPLQCHIVRYYLPKTLISRSKWVGPPTNSHFSNLTLMTLLGACLICLHCNNMQELVEKSKNWKIEQKSKNRIITNQIEMRTLILSFFLFFDSYSVLLVKNLPNTKNWINTNKIISFSMWTIIVFFTFVSIIPIVEWCSDTKGNRNPNYDMENIHVTTRESTRWWTSKMRRILRVSNPNYYANWSGTIKEIAYHANISSRFSGIRLTRLTQLAIFKFLNRGINIS